MVDGKLLRKEKLALRDSLNESERHEKSRSIAAKLLQLKAIIDAKAVFIYVSFRSEVSTFFLIDTFLKNKKRVAVPITHVKEQRMDAVEIYDVGRDLIPGYCGILEPNAERLQNNVMDPETVDAVIIPGSVFDERGGRFGYGGGYYDRFLERIPGAVRAGLAFEVQMVEKAPIQQHDELLDYIITEKRLIHGERS